MLDAQANLSPMRNRMLSGKQLILCVCFRSGRLQTGEGLHCCCCCCSPRHIRPGHSPGCSRRRRRPRATTAPASCLQAASTQAVSGGSWLAAVFAPATRPDMHLRISSGLHALSRQLPMPLLLLHSTQSEYSQVMAWGKDVLLSKGPVSASAPESVLMRHTC